MKNHILLLLSFVTAFIFSAPALAAPPEEAKVEEAKVEEKKTEEVKVEEAKVEVKEEPKAEEKTAEGTKSEELKPVVIEDNDQAMAIVHQLIGAAKAGHWPLVASLGIMLIVFLVGRIGLAKKLGPKAMPWVAATLSILGYVAAAMMLEGTAIVDAITGGFMVGATAVGLWEMLFKHFLKNKMTGEPVMEAPVAD